MMEYRKRGALYSLSDDEWMNYTEQQARKSPDNHTKVGACILSKYEWVVATGFNDFPSNIQHSFERLERPEKYKWLEHAERNAIYNAARSGTSTKDATLYVTLFPCIECSRAIIQAGIKRVVVKYSSQWKPEWLESKDMLVEAGVSVSVI